MSGSFVGSPFGHWINKPEAQAVMEIPEMQRIEIKDQVFEPETDSGPDDIYE